MLLVFDLDGTLIDSARDLADSASEMAQAYGGTELDAADVAMMVGDGAAMLVGRAIAASGARLDVETGLARFLEIYDRRLLNHTRPYDGVKDALAYASRRHRLAVLTNKPTRPTQRILAGLALDVLFDGVVGGDGPYPKKPDPAGLRALMGEQASHAVALVGDSPIDEATARAVGCPFVLARYGFGYRRYEGTPPETPFVLERASDLPAIIDRLERVMSGA